jgi:hypothetical protein
MVVLQEEHKLNSYAIKWKKKHKRKKDWIAMKNWFKWKNDDLDVVIWNTNVLWRIAICLASSILIILLKKIRSKKGTPLSSCSWPRGNVFCVFTFEGIYYY